MATLSAQQYWDSYYAQPFVYGMGTEDILALLRTIPQVHDWTDLGSGSESLFWACALRAERLTAVDLDSERLTLLEANARTPATRGAYTTAMSLGGRSPDEWPAVCATLQHTKEADCLHGSLPDLTPADLVTQFGFLGLCADDIQFTDRVAWMADLTARGGWMAGANWMSAIHPGRLQLSETLYTTAFAHSHAELRDLRRIPSTDPDYPEIWAYVAAVPET